MHSLFGRTDTNGTPFAKYSARIYVGICSVAKVVFTLLCLDRYVQLERCNPWPLGIPNPGDYFQTGFRVWTPSNPGSGFATLKSSRQAGDVYGVYK